MKKKQRKYKQKQQHHEPATVPTTAPHAPAPPHDNRATSDETPCITTETGELFQPVRIYYKGVQRQAVVDAFLHMHCMTFVPSEERWVWLYAHEAAKLPFSRTPLSSDETPWALGSFAFVGRRVLILDVSSFHRALEAIPFFDAHIPRKAASLSHMGILNRVFGEEDIATFCRDTVFRNDGVFHDRSWLLIVKLLWITLRTRNMQKRLMHLDKVVNTQLQTPDPELEYLAIRYYREGLQQLRVMLQMRQQVAMQRWQGNTDYSHKDQVDHMVQQMFGKVPVHDKLTP